MARFAGISALLSILVGWGVTARLFALARHSRAAPERLLAIAFGGLFCVGFPLASASRAPAMIMTNEGLLLYAMGSIGMVVGISALARFPYVVFRAGRRWAPLLSIAIGVTGAVGGLGAAWVVAFAPTRETMVAGIQPWTLPLVTAALASCLWNGLESIAYYGKMKKCAALGLSNPETTHRFLLWGLASILSVVGAAAMITIRAAGLPIMAPLGGSIIACTTFATAACWWRAFFMRDAYPRIFLGIDPSSA
ncbi:MAG: hypothetical protein CL931_12575 [Deltaproteobacteria bacterium]|nr:hypothetical protein [Deltaproteobacteria bacterium]